MTAIDLRQLAAPFPPAAVSWRVGSTTKDKSKGMALAYIDARDVQDRLDEVCGPANWQVRNPWSDGKRLYCEVGIRIDGEWIWKGDGAGDTDVEAEKGAFSDAFKRAAVKWGVGRYLYDLDNPWVALEPAGNSYRIAQAEHAKLRALLQRSGPRAVESEARAPAAVPAAAPPPGTSYPLYDESGVTIHTFERGSEWLNAALTKVIGSKEPAAMWSRNEVVFGVVRDDVAKIANRNKADEAKGKVAAFQAAIAKHLGLSETNTMLGAA